MTSVARPYSPPRASPATAPGAREGPGSQHSAAAAQGAPAPYGPVPADGPVAAAALPDGPARGMYRWSQGWQLPFLPDVTSTTSAALSEAWLLAQAGGAAERPRSRCPDAACGPGPRPWLREHGCAAGQSSWVAPAHDGPSAITALPWHAAPQSSAPGAPAPAPSQPLRAAAGAAAACGGAAGASAAAPDAWSGCGACEPRGGAPGSARRGRAGPAAPARTGAAPPPATGGRRAMSSVRCVTMTEIACGTAAHGSAPSVQRQRLDGCHEPV